MVRAVAKKGKKDREKMHSEKCPAGRGEGGPLAATVRAERLFLTQ